MRQRLPLTSTASASGTVSWQPITGALSTTEAGNDTAALAGDHRRRLEALGRFDEHNLASLDRLHGFFGQRDRDGVRRPTRLDPRAKALPIRLVTSPISQRPTIQAAMAPRTFRPKSAPCVLRKFQMTSVFMFCFPKF